MPLSEQQARDNLKQIIDDYNGLTDEHRKSASEADVVRFIHRLFKDILGWPVDDVTLYQQELSMEIGRPDITLQLAQGEKLFVEAKRFGIIKDLETPEAKRSLDGVLLPQQLQLPGMATDRSPQEQQAINYAFYADSNKIHI